jgi:hypothetical protein
MSERMIPILAAAAVIGLFSFGCWAGRDFGAFHHCHSQGYTGQHRVDKGRIICQETRDVQAQESSR